MDDEYYTNIDTSNQDSMLQSLIFPFADQEPDIHGLELAAIDKIAEEVEFSQLKDLCVLLPPETLSGQSPNVFRQDLLRLGVTRPSMDVGNGLGGHATWRVNMRGSHQRGKICFLLLLAV